MSNDLPKELLNAIFLELRRLNERQGASRDSLRSMCIELGIAGVGGALNVMRCLETLMASGADPTRLREAIDAYLRRTVVNDAALMVELAGVPVKRAPITTLADVVATVHARENSAPEPTREVECREIRVTPAEAAAGCMLPIRYRGRIEHVTLPSGMRDGDMFTFRGDPRHPEDDLHVVVSVVACRATPIYPSPPRKHANGHNKRGSGTTESS